ncbi:MAG TPA: hypothetical protein VM029_14025 [Opitutaceae bacterium]|nr:hypothetical protein [Opitutaceae bacterium]
MLKTSLLLSGLALSALFTGGCVGTGPHTEGGAVTGAALGALAGGIIGNNSRGGDTIGGAVIGAAAGAIAGGTIGNSIDHEQGSIYGAPGRYENPDDRRYRTSRVQASTPPPTPVDRVPPQPAPNAIWVPGYWIYDTRTYTWVSGRWEIPPPFAHTYVPAHSEMRNGQMVHVPGYWQ